MKQLLYIISAMVVLTATACRKYVEIAPENIRELKYTRDYQALINNSAFQMDKAYTFPLFAADETWAADGSVWQNNLSINYAGFYTWLPKVWTDQQEDQDWVDNYKNIYLSNTVINEVLNSLSGTEAEKIKAYSEALVHRAFAYFTLVNLYGKQYDAATATTDLGVPLVLQNNFIASLKRVSVAEVYNRVLTDLQEALPNLAPLPDYNTSPSKAAVYALLAKVYQNQREFTKAGLYADSTLQLKNGLVDLNSYGATYPTKLNDPENILSKIVSLTPTSLPLSPELINLFDTTNDLRYRIFTLPGASIPAANFTNRGYNKHRLLNQGIYVGPRVPETMLIKAESEARAGNTATAVSILNTLRKKRLITTAYTDLTAANKDEALQLVITERRKELMGTGARWFDQRRLQKDNGFITDVSRVFKGVTYTLPVGSNQYVFAISDKYIRLNPEIEQNPR